MALLDEIRYHKSHLEAVGKEYGIYNIHIFGSAVRGDERPDSDVDLLVDVENGRSLVDFSGFRLQAKEMLKREVDLVQITAMHPILKERILSEAQPL